MCVSILERYTLLCGFAVFFISSLTLLTQRHTHSWVCAYEEENYTRTIVSAYAVSKGKIRKVCVNWKELQLTYTALDIGECINACVIRNECGKFQSTTHISNHNGILSKAMVFVLNIVSTAWTHTLLNKFDSHRFWSVLFLLRILIDFNKAFGLNK